MRRRFLIGAGVVLLILSATLVIWEGSFTFGDYAPTSPAQTFLFWAVSTLIFLLTVTLGFMLFRTASSCTWSGAAIAKARASGRSWWSARWR